MGGSGSTIASCLLLLTLHHTHVLPDDPMNDDIPDFDDSWLRISGDSNLPDHDDFIDSIASSSAAQIYEGIKGPNSLSLGPAVHAFLRDIAGIPTNDAAAAGWKSYVPHDNPFGPRILIPARKRDGTLLGVREIAVSSNSFLAGQDSYSLDGSPFILTRRFTAAERQKLNVADVPTPLYPGLFDQAVVWVSYDPVDALLLRKAGMNATALADPCRTMGSDEGIHQLSNLGALSASGRPRGTLVLLDPEQRLDDNEGALLNGMFEEVIEYSRGTGRLLYNVVHSLLDDEGPSFVESNLLEFVRDRGDTCEVHRRPLRRLQVGGGAVSDYPAPRIIRGDELDRVRASNSKWLVEGLIVAGGITEVQGQPWHGKTTFLLALMVAVARGTRFLDLECPEGGILLVTEQDAGTVDDQLNDLSERDKGGPNFHVFPVEYHHQMSWSEKLAFVRETCREHDIKLVVFDTVAQVAGLADDNNASAVRKMLGSLRSISSDGTAVVVVHHGNKAGRGGPAQTGLGSIAFAGAVDHTVRIVRRDDRSRVRHIQIESRQMKATRYKVKLTDDGRWVRDGDEDADEPVGSRTNLGLSSREKGSTTGEFVLAKPPTVGEDGGSGMSPDELVSVAEKAAEDGEWAPKASSIRAVLNELLTQGRIRQASGTGRRGSPRRYCLIPPPPPKGGAGGMELEE